MNEETLTNPEQVTILGNSAHRLRGHNDESLEAALRILVEIHREEKVATHLGLSKNSGEARGCFEEASATGG